MDADRWTQIDKLLQSALDHPTSERHEFLRNACAGDEALESEVRSLLAAQEEAGSFLISPAINVAAQGLAMESSRGELRPGENQTAPARPLPAGIGQYRIVALLGEGGMGVVYEAFQEHPRRTVALKVVKPGLDPSLLRRFEHESQALARLQHPGIAQIYEVGMADTGSGPQPYFAMEFIHGKTVLAHIQAHHLGLRERLTLMVKICQAVEHAHQRSLIHRDLKPGNILVDETGQPKILDFGVAHATDSEAQVTRQTDVGQLVGTLEYMSPEQVMADPAEIDTRSDVYALGVIFYELLAGRRPYKLSRRLHEAVQTIREEDPEPLSSVNRDYRGDIETIVGKALEKDKERRYGSAIALAADIQRYLADEPITARAPTASYHLRKFVRRHRALVGGTAAVFVILALSAVASTWQAARATRERDRAAAAEQAASTERDRARSAEKAASAAQNQAIEGRNRAILEKQRADNEAATAKAVNDFLQNDLLAQASSQSQSNAGGKPDPDLKVRTALDRAAARIEGKFGAQPLLEASLRETIGGTYLDLGLYPQAQSQIERALELRRRLLGADHPDTLASLNSLAGAFHSQGKYAQAEALYARLYEARRRVLGENHRDTLSAMNGLISVYRDETKYAEAATLMGRALAIQRRTLGEQDPETLNTMLNFAAVLRNQGKYPDAETLLKKVLAIQRRTLGEEHPEVIKTLDLLALQYREQGNYQQSEALYAQSLDLHRRVYGNEHPDTLETMNGLAVLKRVNGKYAQAEELLSQALEIERRTLGEEHPLTILSMGELPGVYWVEGKYAVAEPLYIKVLDLRRRLLGEEHDDTVSTMNNLATLYMSEGKYPEAEPLLVKVVDIRKRVRGEDNPRTLISTNNLAVLYVYQGNYPRAETLFAKVLADRRRVLGENNPDTLKTLDGLANVYRYEGKYPEAELLLIKAIEARRRVLGENNPDTFVSLNNLALLYLEEKKYSEAEGSLFQALEARRRILGADHPDTIGTLNAIGRLRLEQRRYAEAESALREAMAHQAKRSTDSWDKYDTQSMLGASLAGQGKYDDAEPLLLSGYDGIRKRESAIPAPSRSALDRAGLRIVQLYRDWAKPAKLAEWRGKLERTSKPPD